MTRAVSLYLPFWPADRLRRQLGTRSAAPAPEKRPLPAGQEVVEDYGATSLTLRAHPFAFLRSDLAAKRIRPCAEILHAKDSAWLSIAGIVLLRQRPGSASGVLFITIEDETGLANLIVWPKIFERQRRLILSAAMIGVRGRVQRESEVIHLVAQEFFDLPNLLRTVGRRELGQKPGDTFIPDERPESGIKVQSRDFR